MTIVGSFQWSTVLLEWDSNLASSYSANFLKCSFFCNLSFFHFSPVNFFYRWLKKNLIDTNNNSPQLVQKIVDKKDKFLVFLYAYCVG